MKWITPIPTNAKTIAFCLFEGMALSIPVGSYLSQFRHFSLPQWTAPVYGYAVAFSILSLFAWSLMSLRDQTLLACIGLITTLSYFAGVFFPAL
jgi:hypothetical protein